MERTDLKWAALITAIAAGTAGVAEGARELLKGDDIQDGSLDAKELSSKARRALKGNRGPRGLQGLQGLQGIPGANGANGQNGRDGTNGQTGAPGLSVLSLPATNAQPSQFYGTATSPSFTETTVQFRVPVGFSQIRGLAVYASQPDADYTFTVKVDQQATALTCVMTLASKTCSSAGTVVVAPDAKIAIGVTGGAKIATGLSTALTFAQ